jgi:iron complex outermembrane recepter protein
MTMRFTHSFSTMALAIPLAFCILHPKLARAQSSSQTSGTDLADVTVTGNPLQSASPLTPTAQYSGKGLLLRSQGSLGETLSGTPGVSSTYFGPQASRPVIRGLDGDRIRILNNSGSSLDASGLSFDHAVASDPIVVERIELLRGPAALLYGGNAIGGVVNLIDNRLPRARINALQGKADVGLGSGDGSTQGALVLETGGELASGRGVAFHADAHARATADVTVPIALSCAKPGAASVAQKICNSAASAEGGALGATLFTNEGNVGFSHSLYRSHYGSVAEPEVSIKMQSQRSSIETSMKTNAWIKHVKLQVNHTDYRHTEFDGVNASTTFTSAGYDLRLEAEHQSWGRFRGVFGLQVDSSRFGTSGTELFAPNSQSKSTALFWMEEGQFSWGRLSMGARLEDVSVESLGNPNVNRFAIGSRAFSPWSVALGAALDLNPQWRFKSNLSANQRAPKDYELFAHGPHLATSAYELGNTRLGMERSVNLELGLDWQALNASGEKRRDTKAGASVFLNRFSNYLSLEKTGNTRASDGTLNPVDANGDGLVDGSTQSVLPEFAYRQTAARVYGFEVQGSFPITLLSEQVSRWDLQWRADYVKGINTLTQAFLPRIAPLRLGASLLWAQQPGAAQGWGGRLNVDYFAKPADASTQAYTLVNAALTYESKAKFAGSDARLTWYARIDNLSDKLAYSATSILTQTLPGRVPLPGRTFKLGVQAVF